MFEGILKAFKKRLVADRDKEKEVQTEMAPVNTSQQIEEPEEFDILSYVDKHGVVNKDKHSEKKADSESEDSPFNTLKKKKSQSKVTVDVGEAFEEPEPQPNKSEAMILEHINTFGVYNKDSSTFSDEDHMGKQNPRSIYKNKRAMEKRIDLHGMSLEEADRYIKREIEQAKAVGITQLLIVHGRGMHSRSNGGADVLRQHVRDLFTHELHHLIYSFKYASGAEGGDGATRIFLK